jgi:hypothetical protein
MFVARGCACRLALDAAVTHGVPHDGDSVESAIQFDLLAYLLDVLYFAIATSLLAVVTLRVVNDLVLTRKVQERHYVKGLMSFYLARSESYDNKEKHNDIMNDK